MEGEGSFIQRKLKELAVTVASTNYDVLFKLQQITGGHINKRLSKHDKPHWKPSWIWQLTKYANAERLMIQILSYMGYRRSIKIQQLLKLYQHGFHNKAYQRLKQYLKIKESFNSSKQTIQQFAQHINNCCRRHIADILSDKCKISAFILTPY